MEGWIKLWRKLKNNGHLKMPGTAFKLWIYCLLEAAPYPDRARALEAGELWLNYEHVRQVIGEADRQMSKSTVSSALKYLATKGYVELEVKQFYGVKARVINWQDYQSSTETVPVPVPVEDMSSTETVPGKNSEMTPVCMLPGTQTVPVDGSPGTVTSTVTSTETVPGPVLARASEPYGGAASGTPKNNKNKDLNNTVVVVNLITSFEKEFGRPLSPLEVDQLAKWRSELPEDLILEALTQAVIRNKRTLAYTGGILLNWQRAGIRTADEARQDKLRRSRRTGRQAGRQDPAGSKKKEFIKTLYV
ncbi:MAG: DNA replication protein DnaD [Pelotomaculum sp. PtaB.Bin013]|uniref:DnaD domain protein n=1 Tax=Pelotomaculum isophthalicicum JI TaxID=947010 RepID=A0A9X4JVX6_9FIRM|nr:DnaD domain protein [Pelotomaculum isophthalicicum]MDF9408202.1 DnaD domain protein [Pelotomaculum isophthalicicum JI]OPX91818.1 MAG: DNA replication protein DnaD [Pelotomaculum sp. PtaB.Bin013]